MSVARTYTPTIGITIRHTNCKTEVTKQDLDLALSQLLTACPHLHIVDRGFHINGKHHQLHLHILAKGFNPIKYIAPYYYHTEVINTVKGYRHYIHSDDHNNKHKLAQVLIENYSNHHCMVK